MYLHLTFIDNPRSVGVEENCMSGDGSFAQISVYYEVSVKTGCARTKIGCIENMGKHNVVLININRKFYF